MKRFRDTLRLVYIGAVLISGSVCALTAGLFARSYFIADGIELRQMAFEGVGIKSIRGVLYLERTWFEREPELKSAYKFRYAQTSLKRELEPHRTRLGFVHRQRAWMFLSLGGGPPQHFITHYFSVPYWLPILLTGLPPGIAGWRSYRRMQIKPGCCRNCGYDLRASPQRCPECGTNVVDWRDVMSV